MINKLVVTHCFFLNIKLRMQEIFQLQVTATEFFVLAKLFSLRFPRHFRLRVCFILKFQSVHEN